MRFRLGFLIGLAAGYYAGTKAGRQRYEQINRIGRRLRRSEVFEAATEKAKSTIEGGVEKARDLVGNRIGRDNNGDAPSNGTLPTRFS